MMKRSKRCNAGLKPKRFRDSLPFKGGTSCSFPCTLCSLQCNNDAIECSDCGLWTHFKCLKIDATFLNTWSEESMHFLCSKCAFSDGKYDFKEALRRLVYYAIMFPICVLLKMSTIYIAL